MKNSSKSVLKIKDFWKILGLNVIHPDKKIVKISS